MKKNCATCDAEFEANTCGKYCSLDCTNASRRKAWHNVSKEEARKRSEYSKAHWHANKTLVEVKPKPCDWCGDMFVGYRNDVKCCSEECRRKRHIKRTTARNTRCREEKFGPPTERTCEVCSEPFTPRIRNSNQLTCSNKCLTKKRNMKRLATPKGRLNGRIRNSINNCLKKGGIVKSGRTFDLLGYSPEELFTHFESYFTEENGYTWDNIDEWHIDHIRPVASFNYDSTDHPDFKKCWALNNLQPLWAFDNMSKGDKWDGVVNA